MPVVQSPVPLHCPIAVCEPFEHDALPQDVPDQSAHVPVAVHVPLVPQPVVAVTWHVPLGSVVPLLTLAQVPLVPPVSAAEHAWHWELHALLQQTPLTQLPLVH